MKKRLRVKFAILYALFALLSFLTVSTFGMSLARKYVTKSVADGLYQDASRIASGSLIQSYMKSLSSREALYHFLSSAAAYQNSTIWLTDISGNILIDTSRPFEETDDPKTLPEMDSEAFTGSYYQIGTFFGYYSSDVLSVGSPVTSGDTVRLSHHPLLSQRSNRNVIPSEYFLILLAILGLSLILVLGFGFLSAVRWNGSSMPPKNMPAGNLDYRFIKEPADELEYLGASLQVLAGQAGKGGENQRKFISNISHDFRSPLTSIKGYVEAILDGTIPVEMQDRYLNIVLSETERLEKLTKGLLTLNTFDDNGYLMEMSDFDINEVIRKSLETFEGRCNARGIRFSLLFDEPCLPVHADKEKIQQVLYNLIDNAIKFSPDHSVIYMETLLKREKVFVSIKDTGLGIPQNSLPKIWDRFYKTDLSRGKDKKGTGLGLAIVKEIIQAHGENINVVSTEGVGSEFTFTLQSAS